MTETVQNATAAAREAAAAARETEEAAQRLAKLEEQISALIPAWREAQNAASEKAAAEKIAVEKAKEAAISAFAETGESNFSAIVTVSVKPIATWADDKTVVDFLRESGNQDLIVETFSKSAVKKAVSELPSNVYEEVMTPTASFQRKNALAL